MLELFGRSDRDTRFTDQLWNDYRKLASAIDLPFQEELRFYGLGGEPNISDNDLDSMLEALARTSFASLYASLSWAEDGSREAD